MAFDPSRADSDDASPTNPLGDALTPNLLKACGGRLSDLDWFQSPWQNGGASTAFATWRGDDGEPVPVLVKVPVGYRELFWTQSLSEFASPAPGARSRGLERIAGNRLPTPRVYACGETLNGYDLAWLVIERLGGQPLAQQPTEQGLLDLLDAAADFQLAAARIRPPMEGIPPESPDWPALIARARDLCHEGVVAHAQRWNAALKKVGKLLPDLMHKWAHRPIDSWCHGDLHAANALRRTWTPQPVPAPAAGAVRGDGRAAAADPEERTQSRAVLIDLAMVHAGCWIEDAVYLERTCWAQPGHLFGLKPVNVLARKRRERGLPVSDLAYELADVRRVLMAASTLAHHARRGDDAYTDAALVQVEQALRALR